MSSVVFEMNPNVASTSTICVPALNNPPFNVNILPVDDFDFGNALESVYPILHIIFEYLTNVELQTVALVKPSWKEVANEILNKRTALSWMVLSKKFINAKTTKILNTFVNVKYTNVDVALIVIRHKKCSLNKHVCVHKSNGVKSIPFSEYLSNEVLPKDVKCCVLSSSRLYPIFSEVEEKENEFLLTSGLLFPAIPKIRTVLFYASVKNIVKTKMKYIQENEQIKALFLFCLSEPYKPMSFLKTFLENQEPIEVALGGGIIKGMKLYPSNVDEKLVNRGHYACIALLENKHEAADFTALSVVFGSNQCFSEKLQKIKEKITLRSQTVAIRICSYGSLNRVSLVTDFNKVFPNVPLLSFNSSGEIGWNSGVLYEDINGKEKDAKKCKQIFPEHQHQLSTVIVFLMWGKAV